MDYYPAPPMPVIPIDQKSEHKHILRIRDDENNRKYDYKFNSPDERNKALKEPIEFVL